MDTSPVDFSGDYIDSQEVIDRLEELNGLGICIDSEQREELTELTSFAKEGESYIDDWEYGTTLTRDTAMSIDYAQEYVSGMGEGCGGFLEQYIDWDSMLEDLMQDMECISSADGTSWYRG